MVTLGRSDFSVFDFFFLFFGILLEADVQGVLKEFLFEVFVDGVSPVEVSSLILRIIEGKHVLVGNFELF